MYCTVVLWCGQSNAQTLACTILMSSRKPVPLSAALAAHVHSLNLLIKFPPIIYCYIFIIPAHTTDISLCVCSLI